MARGHLLSAPAIVVLLPLAAHAASFDCRSARSPQERLVCATPALSTLDDRLARAFLEQLARLSPEGQDLLRRDERLWLAYAGTVCSKPEADALYARPEACLTAEYADRLLALQRTTSVAGGWTFQHVVQQRAVPISDPNDGSGHHPGFATEERSYLRIDAPRTEAARRWNAKAVAAFSDRLDAGDDVSEEMTLKLATPNFLCVELESGFYGHQTPHGTGVIGYRNVILAPEYREALPDDLFKSGGRWKTIVSDAIAAQVGEAETIENEDNEITNAALQKSIAADTSSLNSWLIGRKDITIQFNPYELGTYIFRPTVVIPWSDLRDELKPESPLADIIDLSPAR